MCAAGALFAASSACAVLSGVQPPPQLFSAAAAVTQVDFEAGSLGQLPEGFTLRSGAWTVADSPTALSGNQVLVRGGETPAALLVTATEAAQGVAAEVALRVLTGSLGAGIACETGEGGSGYLLKLEPAAKRVVLLQINTADTTLAAARAANPVDGDWVRLGLRCDGDRVVGYLDGKPVGPVSGISRPVSLALYADGGTIVQFDDLHYAAKK